MHPPQLNKKDIADDDDDDDVKQAKLERDIQKRAELSIKQDWLH